ncbi:hypothetical protein [Bacillus pseudomycoides]|uniref:hypothetical protein n=1 Tax=Bacillus pseudomycoides TaxID=64104 RepID=UPI0023DB3E4E|nr:hypothetical protein [Bacillus pseudomycoides]MDF2084640.1 hypothetical protein [Bacillus pseudomycoides]
MRQEESFQHYNTFIQKNFPQSFFLKQPEQSARRFFSLVHGRVIFFDVILRNFQLDQNKLQFLNVLNFNLVRLLYSVPTNDDYIINFNFRTLIESVLKSLYFGLVFPENNNYNVQYRNLKDDLKASSIYSKYKDECDQMFNYYSEYSEELHQKKGVSVYPNSFLQDIMVNPPTISLEKRNAQIARMINFSETIILDFPEVNLQELSGPDRYLLQNELGSKWFNSRFTIQNV